MTVPDRRPSPTTGAELRALRCSAGLSQAALARLIGCSRSAVFYWETQRIIANGQLRYRLLKVIGEVLGFRYTPNKFSRTRARCAAGRYAGCMAQVVDMVRVATTLRLCMVSGRFKYPTCVRWSLCCNS